MTIFFCRIVCLQPSRLELLQLTHEIKQATLAAELPVIHRDNVLTTPCPHVSCGSARRMNMELELDTVRRRVVSCGEMGV